MSRLEITISDYKANWKRFEDVISPQTLKEIDTFLSLGKRWFRMNFESEIGDVFSRTKYLETLPHHLRMLVAKKAQVNLEIKKTDTMLLQALAYLDGGLTEFRKRGKQEASDREVRLGLPWLLRGHFQCRNYLKDLFPDKINESQCYQYMPRMEIGTKAMRPVILPGECHFTSAGIVHDIKDEPETSGKRVIKYTQEYPDGSYDNFDFESRQFSNSSRSTSTCRLYSMTFTKDYVVSWVIGMDASYESVFHIRPTSHRPPSNQKFKVSNLKLPGLEKSDGNFYSVNWIKDNLIAISYIPEINRSVEPIRGFEATLAEMDGLTNSYSRICQLKTAIFDVSIKKRSHKTNPTAKLIDIKPGWFIKSTNNAMVLASEIASEKEDSVYFAHIGIDSSNYLSKALKNMILLPRLVKSFAVYNMSSLDTLQNVEPAIIPNAHVNLMNPDFGNGDDTKPKNEMFADSVRASESNGYLEIAIIDTHADKGSHWLSLGTFRLQYVDNGSFTLSGSATLNSQPPLSCLAPDWRYFNHEIVFLSNDRIPTISRNNEDWESTCEILVTKMNFLKVDYEKSVIYRDRQERAYGYYDKVDDYNYEDWAHPYDWGNEPWAEFSIKFLSQFSLQLTNYQKVKVN